MNQNYSTYIDYFEFRQYKPDSTDTKRSSALPYTSLPGPSIVHIPSPSFLGPYQSSIPIPAPKHGFGTKLSTVRKLYCNSNSRHSSALFDHFESTKLLAELRTKIVTKDINIIASPNFGSQNENNKPTPAPPIPKQPPPPPYPQHPDRSYSAVAHHSRGRNRELVKDSFKPLIANQHLDTRNYYPSQNQMNPVSRKSSRGKSCSSSSCCKPLTSSSFYHHNPNFVTIGITCKSISSVLPKRKLNNNSKQPIEIEFSGIPGAQAVPSSSSSMGDDKAFQWVVPEKPGVSKSKISKKPKL